MAYGDRPSVTMVQPDKLMAFLRIVVGSTS